MCESCQWKETVERLDELINDDDHRFSFAFDTLSGIKTTVTQREHITERQLSAINNIETAGKRKR